MAALPAGARPPYSPTSARCTPARPARRRLWGGSWPSPRCTRWSSSPSPGPSPCPSPRSRWP
ncbi:hypothetical protein LT493_08620 [Streptomyces tricolor]|nr:hypothetical protein [Streptomyces tricolor]